MRKTARVHHYKVIVERGEDGYFIARVPALPGCLTQAETYEELMRRGKEGIQLCLEVAELDTRYRRKVNVAYEPTFIGIEEIAVAV